MSHLVLAYALAILWLLTGFLFIPKKLMATFGEKVPWAFGIGALAWGYGQFLFNLAGGILERRALLCAAAVMGIVAFVFAWRTRKPWRFAWIHEEASWSEALACLILLLVFFTAAMESSALPLYHVDAVVCFGVKAKALFLSGTFKIPFFYEQSIVHVQPDYPLLVPYLESLFYKFCGSIDDVIVKHIFLVYAVIVMTLVYQSLRRRMERLTALLVTACFASMPLFLADMDTQCVSGCADIVFILYITISGLAAVYWMQTRSLGWRRLVVLGSLGCLFCKPQGVPFCAILWCSLWFRMKSDRRAWTRGLLEFAVLSAPWVLASHFLPLELIFPPLKISVEVIRSAFDKVPPLFIVLMQEPWHLERWGLYWPMLIFLGFYKRRPTNRSVQFLWILIALQGMSYGAVYLVYPQPISWWISSSLTRWLTHGSPLLVIAAAWSYADVKE